jgi:site-specific DNA recombinase
VRQPLAAVIRSSDRVAERRRAGTYQGDEEQLAEIERYCQERSLAYEVLPPELDMSGGLPIERRPSLLAAVEGVEAGRYSGIVVANVKRLTRSRNGHLIWERVEAAGGHVHTAAENTDTSTVSGRFVRDMFIAEAVREREEHAERHAKRRATTVARGMWRQWQVPRGYMFAGPAVDGRYVGAARRLVPSPDADEVRRAAQDVLAGVPMTEVARRLGMTASGVRGMLRNRVYLGELRDGPNVNPAAHEPILDVDIFEAVQRALARNPRPPRAHDGPALLAGLVRCSGCGHVMSRSRGKVAVYRCAEHHSGARCPAPAAVTLARLDEHVQDIACAELTRLSVTASKGERLSDLRAALDAAQRALNNAMGAFAEAGVMGEPVATDTLAKLRDARDDAAEALRAEQEREAVAPVFQHGADVWPALDVAERNRLLRALLAGVVVERSGGRGRIRPLGERVRVFAFGAPVRFAEGGRGKIGGIVPVPLADLDSPHVLRVPSAEDRDEFAGGIL